MIVNCIWWWGSSSGALVCVEYPFIAIIHKSDTTCYSPMYGSNGSVQKLLQLGLVGFSGISTIVGYSIPNPFNTYILDIYDWVWLGFYGISTTVGY